MFIPIQLKTLKSCLKKQIERKSSFCSNTRSNSFIAEYPLCTQACIPIFCYLTGIQKLSNASFIKPCLRRWEGNNAIKSHSPWGLWTCFLYLIGARGILFFSAPIAHSENSGDRLGFTFCDLFYSTHHSGTLKTFDSCHLFLRQKRMTFMLSRKYICSHHSFSCTGSQTCCPG